MAGNNWLVRIRLDEVLGFLPGQYASIKVSSEGMRRSYSVAGLREGKIMDLLVDVSPMGVGSKYILDLKENDEVEILGFLGRFTLDDLLLSKAKSLLFVATGTGIAPFRPMIEELLYEKHFAREVRLVWGMRHEEDLYWVKELNDLNTGFDNFKLDITISKPGVSWQGLSGRVELVINKLDQDWNNTLVYLCGSNEMITETAKKMKDKGVPEANIFYEKYF